ncbi:MULTISPECIES: hypothetical protein [Halorussus]|uniref:hypothetical protein n=1 Tax=Halorussus TaxID=1070314 RepID=UPI0020A18EAA|nr:hypothetical protein [Halorussus vallis]USZ75648.1 hypothetical protein NGM07_19745 [Halorussus vallis]USZ75702.1 hypothetical protein NGM07_20020 [Halorussus vallis]
MSTKQPVWFCPTEVIDHNCEIARHMDIRAWKALKAAFISTLILGLAGYAIHRGADPTSIALAALAITALLNGVELRELAAVKGIQVVREGDPANKTETDEKTDTQRSESKR